LIFIFSPLLPFSPMLFRLPIFGLVVYLTSLIVSRFGNIRVLSSKQVPFRPPDWVFGVVWPVLFATTGMAWSLSREDALFSALTFLCSLWLVVYAALKRKALATIVLTASCVLSLYLTVSLAETPGALMIPVTAWTGFAIYLNAFDALS
jgi:tryptophan-rich sensory protein